MCYWTLEARASSGAVMRKAGGETVEDASGQARLNIHWRKAAMISGEAAGDIHIGKPFTADNSPKPALIQNRGRQTLTTYRSRPYEINIMTPDRNSTLKRFTVYNSLNVLTESSGHSIKSVVPHPWRNLPRLRPVNGYCYFCCPAPSTTWAANVTQGER
jgi:hypothetical protein